MILMVNHTPDLINMVNDSFIQQWIDVVKS